MNVCMFTNKIIHPWENKKKKVIEKKENLKYFNDQFFFVIDMAHFD